MKNVIELCDPPVFYAEVIFSLEAKNGRVKLPVDTAEATGAGHGESRQKGLNLLPHVRGQLMIPDKLLKKIDTGIHNSIHVNIIIPEYGEDM